MVLAIEFVLELVDDVEPINACVVEPEPQRVDPSVLGRQNVGNEGLDRRSIDKRRGFTPVVWNGVGDLFQRVKNPQAPHAGHVAVKGKERVLDATGAIGRNHLLVRLPQGQPHPWHELGTGKHIVALPVGLVGVVRQVVVFEAIDPSVVVQVDAKEEFGSINRIAQKRLFIVGNEVVDRAIVVLVKIRDKIVVLVPPRKDEPVIGRTRADPVGILVLVVVVLDKLVEVALGIVVLNVAVGIDQKSRGRIRVVHRIDFSEKEPRMELTGEVKKPSVGLLGGNFVIFASRKQRSVGILIIALVAVPLSIEVNPPQPLALHCKSAD